MTQHNLVDFLRSRAEQWPARHAFTYLEDGVNEAGSFDYASLETQARAFAARLREISRPGERALLLFPAGLDFLTGFFGCLFADVIGIPTPPPEASRLKRTGPRLRAIVDDADATLVVTTAKIRALIEAADDPLFESRKLRWLTTDEINLRDANDWREPRFSADPLAYLQYTSGSTSTPKGVMIGHRNVLHHLGQLQRFCRYDENSVTVTWMPNFHDYGLVEGLLEPVHNGTPCYIMSPIAFVKRPIVWLRAIEKYRGTHSQAPNFAYDHCVRRITPEQRVGLNLSSWKAAGNAAEPIHPNVTEAFIRTFEPHGFDRRAMCPAFGLAEATLLVSSNPVDEPPAISRLDADALEQHHIADASSNNDARLVVGCGRVFGETRVAIVDPESRRECGNEVGEIWVKSADVAQGYWNRTEESAAIFQARIANTNEGPFLRTGDLGFLKDGELHVCGRIKDLIIIRGTNHHPQDIEWTVQAAHPGLRPENGAAFSMVVEGEERLVIAQELEREHASGLDFEMLLQTVRRAVAESHELDVYAFILLARGSIPKTASGKIQRQNCREFLDETGPRILGSWRAPIARATELKPQGPIAPAPLPIGEYATPEVSRQRADELIAWLRKYASERINSRIMDERRCVPPYILMDFGNRGVMGIRVPDSHGGLGLRYVDALRVLEQLAAIDLTLAAIVFLNVSNGLIPIQQHAKPALRDELLPMLASGRELGSFALSEPAAGSNLGGMVGQAVPNGKGGWTIRAFKRWNSGSWAGVVSVFVRLVDEKGRLGGMTGFVVRQGTPGLRVGPEALTMGLRASVQNSLIFDNVEVGPEHVLGELGQGMAVAENVLTNGRLCISAACIGGLKRCAQLVGRYAKRRTISSGKLASNPSSIAVLSELTALIPALQALANQIAARYDQNSPVPPELPMCAKVLTTEALNWASGQLLQLLGGRGYMENNIAPQLFRDARALSVGEGPNEPLTIQIGRAARHNRTIDAYMNGTPEGADLAKSIAAIATEAAERCKNAPSLAVDVTTTQLWTDWLVGQVVSEAVLLAAIREAYRNDPSNENKRSLLWVELRYARAVQLARKGRPEERLMATEDVLGETIAAYASDIGDVEQTLPGEEDWVDPFLVRDPEPAAFNPFLNPNWPGNAQPEEQVSKISQPTAPSASTPSRREQLAALLRAKIATELSA